MVTVVMMVNSNGEVIRVVSLFELISRSGAHSDLITSFLFLTPQVPADDGLCYGWLLSSNPEDELSRANQLYM